MNTNQSFNSLIEKYSFAIADTFIQSASSTDQASLIAFLSKIGTCPTTGSRLPEQAHKKVAETWVDTPFSRLEQQWQAALTVPLAALKDLAKPMRAFLYKSMTINQQQINSTAALIQRMEELLERAQYTIHDPVSQNRLAGHYQSIQANYTTHLVRLQAFQQVTLRLLDQ